MKIVDIVLIVITLLVSLINFALILKLSKANRSNMDESNLRKIREAVSEAVNNLGLTISSNIAEKNSYILKNVYDNNLELNKKMTTLIEDFNKQREEIAKNNLEFNSQINKKIGDFEINFLQKYSEQNDKIMEKLSLDIKEFNKEVNNSLKTNEESLKERLEEFKKTTKEAIGLLNDNVSKNLTEIREDNNKKLDAINSSVNEKLQKTLEDKLKDSFKSVIEGIGYVNQAVGEIKGLASDVGSLKNVLTNVKTKGIMGEVILGNIIKEFLTPGQYAENIATKKGSNERVEFAIILPGTKDDKIYLPVDSKFPYESYSIIHESSDVNEINEARKNLRNNLLKYAKDVSEKYIDVPNTCDFAVIFLPLEGLYLEALNMGLFEEIQKKYRVNLTGPTTFTAFINSLNMGFKSLMIQKKSGEVFDILGQVRTEFNKFATSLEKTQKRFADVSNEFDALVGTRTRMMQSKLNKLDSIDDESLKALLGNNSKE